MPGGRTWQDGVDPLVLRNDGSAAGKNERTGARSRRIVVIVAAGGDVFIGAGAFRLSFVSLSDLARRAGLESDEAWVWPLIVDGLIVVATVAVVALHGHGPKATRYPWILLIAAAAVSVAANAIHALVATDVSVPAVVAGCVGAVPPLVLLGATHLTVELIRWSAIPVTAAPPRAARRPAVTQQQPKVPPAPAAGSARRAAQMRQEGWSNRQIAQRLQVHPSTVGRWLSAPALPSASSRAAISEPRRSHRIDQDDRAEPADRSGRTN
jgi:hypothetical protein